MEFLGLIPLLIFFYWFFTASRPSSQEKRLQTLESQVQWLHEESQRLRAALASREMAGPPAAPSPGAAPVERKLSPAGMPPIPPSAAGQPAPFVDETPTQPGYDLPKMPSPSPAAAPEPSLWQRLISGNILAKIGVVLLFFGVASALRLAVDYGFLPVQLRLLIGAVAGLGMIGFGWVKVRRGEHQTFGIAIQGGGFAILYLVVYFMLARYTLLGPTPAFGLFALLGLACVVLAAMQEGVVLAVFGLAGAFAAPVLASRGGGDPLALLSYFTLLNTFIVGVSWFRNWRILNVTGFLFTLGLCMGWAMSHYHAGHHDVVQGFLLFFWALYSATPVLMALFRAPGWAGWVDGMLAFGTPLAGFALQAWLVADRYELAWYALGAALWYGVLWSPLFRRGDPASLVLERCQLGLAIAFATLAVPLAFGVQVTAAFWALEGVAVVWFGVSQERRLAQFTGSLLQAAAGAYFLAGVQEMTVLHPVFNDLFLGSLLFSAAGFACARLFSRVSGGGALLALFWSLGWWLGAGLHEIEHFAPRVFRAELILLFLTLTLLGLDRYARSRDWEAARQAAVLPAIGLSLAVLWANFTHPGATGGLPYLPLLNAFDMVLIGSMMVTAGWLRGRDGPDAEPGSSSLRWIGALAFVCLSGLAARMAHHWGGVAFTGYALWHSTLLQAMLTLLWTLLAIAAMIRATRIGARRLWQGGFALLAVVGGKLMWVDLANAGTVMWTGSLIGVALLVLAAGYFAPAPPEDGAVNGSAP